MYSAKLQLQSPNDNGTGSSVMTYLFFIPWLTIAKIVLAIAAIVAVFLILRNTAVFQVSALSTRGIAASPVPSPRLSFKQSTPIDMLYSPN
jgi:hypothetical protein